MADTTIDNSSFTILIVDDEPKNIQILGKILQKEDYEIEFASNGEGALEWLESNPFDLVLLDVMMPGMDGFEVCEQIKSNPDTKNVPVIFLTAKTEAESMLKGFEVGGVDYVTKPFNSTELLARVSTHIELKAQKDLLWKVSQERMDLIHILCHDLANPISIARSLAEEMTEANMEQYREHLIESMKNGLQVVDLVRKMQYLEEHPLQIGPVDLQPAIRMSYQMLKEKFVEKKIELVNHLPEKVMVHAEETTLINSVLSNLFTNAIKFSYSGSQIVLNIEESDDDDEVILSVKDSGIGMPKEIVDHIFKMGNSNSRRGTAGERGTGFGMPLIKKFVTAFGGSIEIQSRDEQSHPDNHGTEIKICFQI